MSRDALRRGSPSRHRMRHGSHGIMDNFLSILAYRICLFALVAWNVLVWDDGLACVCCWRLSRFDLFDLWHRPTWSAAHLSINMHLIWSRQTQKNKKKIENVEEEQWTRRNINHVNKQTAESIQRIPSRESLLCLKRSIEAYMPRNIFGIPLPPGDKLNTTAHRQRIYIYISTSDPLRRTHSSCKGDGRIPPPSD